MGCIYSRKDINDIHPRMFRVFNVDDQGCDLSPGKIEVSDMELILHQKGKEPIRWPWRCLRRYGFDQELFSFESGRRCPLGPGIYAFRCKRAERLFLLVQECIQRAGQEDQVHLSQSVISAAVRTNSRPTSVVEMQDSNGFAPHLPQSQPVTVAEGNGVAHLYVNGPAANEMNEPMNGTVNYSNLPDTSLIDFREAPQVPERINYAVLDLPKSTENLSEEPPARPPAPTNNGEVHYANTDPDAFSEGLPLSAATDADVFLDEEAEAGNVQANYINVTSKINYIQLDLNHGSENGVNGAAAATTSPPSNSNPPDSPTKRNAERESYITIDFKKTTALHNSGRGTVEEEEGSRKTRHSSTISELN